jgi:predicted AlkP superfamily pyrophosphatase or phosphodiesterase
MLSHAADCAVQGPLMAFARGECMSRVPIVSWIVLVWLACAPVAAAADATHVIHISVDGLASGILQSLIDEGQLPNFKRIQSEGAWTNNARTDFDFTITLPNHTSMVTSRPVRDKAASPAAIVGHQWTVNSDPGERTLHTNRHDYVASTFDVAHDNGLRTGVFAGKSKFVVYDQSYDERNGAPDTTGEDNGRDKIDVYLRAGAHEATDRLIEEMKADPFHYTFLHYAEPDSAGHAKKWGSPEYHAAVKKVDECLGKLLALIDGDDRLRGKTAIIISADHGGTGFSHGFNTNPANYVIPFYVWGAGVKPGDLYALNPSSRVDPQAASPDYTERGRQPIRNGDGGNLALSLLGLGPIPGSTINAAQDLKVH